MSRKTLPPRRAQADRRHYVFLLRCGCPFGLAEETPRCQSEDDAWDAMYDTRAEERQARARGVRVVYVGHETYEREFYPRMTQKCPHQTTETTR
jgi:hypothetical protein